MNVRPHFLPPGHKYIECYDLTLYFCMNLLLISVNTMYMFVTCSYAAKIYT